MNKSESIVDLAAAMSKFQGEINNAFRAKAGHGYSYADLASILEQSRPLLAANGLSVIQMPCEAASGFVGVETCICHSSGQFIEQGYSMAVPENKRNSMAQNIGSAITYARRYALAAALGIAQTDEDASEKEAKADVAIIEKMIFEKDSRGVKCNWSELIAQNWGNLSKEQGEALNFLYNTQDTKDSQV